MEIIERITILFDCFVEERMKRCYRFDDAELYSGADTHPGSDDNDNQVFLNPFIKTEHDLAMKFGGFMEEKFLRDGDHFTVHAELGLYQPPGRQRADMSIHQFEGTLWKGRHDIRNSAVAVIEIKGFGYRLPGVYCNVMRMCSDFKKFDSLATPKHTARIVIILDESVAGKGPIPALAERYEQIVSAARLNNVILLSNNPALNSRTVVSAPLLQST